MSTRTAPTPYQVEIARHFIGGHTVTELAAGYHLGVDETERHLRSALRVRASPERCYSRNGFGVRCRLPMEHKTHHRYARRAPRRSGERGRRP